MVTRYLCRTPIFWQCSIKKPWSICLDIGVFGKYLLKEDVAHDAYSLIYYAPLYFFYSKSDREGNFQ